MEEKSLIKNLKVGDENAFKFLVENYKGFIYNTCLSIIQNTEEADDLTQEVFIQIFKFWKLVAILTTASFNFTNHTFINLIFNFSRDKV